ncbi:MAG: hypothetical protein IJX03_05230 [Clostridia bacterium]|nr:hypothetical protein [Clostridia bacterium]
MSKKLTKISLMILTFVFAFCLSIGILGVGNAYASDTVPTLTMQQGASVRTKGDVNGIRFEAIVSANNPNYEYGMMLAPTDWLESEDALNFDMEEYDSTKTYGQNDVYYAKASNKLEERASNDSNVYVLTCSFVNIKESNLSRDFTARAYCAPLVEGVADYDNAILSETCTTNIYTVLSTYYASAEYADLVEEETLTTVTDFVQEACEKVTTKYNKTEITVEGLTDGVAYRDGDAITVKATVSREDDPSTDKNEARTIVSGVKVEIERTVAADVDETLTYDEKTGEIALTTSGVFNVKATVGNTVEDTVATIKRSDVTVTMQDVSWDVSSLSKLNSGQYFKAIAAYGTATDPEKATAGVNYSIRRTGAEWLYINTAVSGNYLLFNPHTKMDGEMFVVATYVDNYGVTYTAEGKVEQKDITASVSFDNTKTKINADVLTLTRDKTAGALCIENVPLTDIENNLIRFANDKTAYMTQTLVVKFVDHNNPDNYVTLYMDPVNGSQNTTTGIFQMRYGILTPVWSGYWANGGQVTGSNVSSKVWSDSRPCCSLRSSLSENHHLLNEDYYRGMLGVTITDNLYINYFKSCTATSITQKAVCSAENQTANSLTAWSGLGDATAVDIYIYGTVRGTDPGSILYIDTLGGGSISGLSQNGNSVIVNHANGSTTEHAIYYAVDCKK